jgi:hypothetical protein
VTCETFRTVWCCSILAAIKFAAPAYSQDPPTRVTLHPMAAPTPALKYRLLPEVADQIPGNAAVYYGKIKAEENAFFGNKELWDKIGGRNDIDYQEMPLAQLKREEIKPKPPAWPIYFLEQGAKCSYCDWQLPIGQAPFYKILLPEAQESRQYMRMLATKARWEIAMGWHEDAIKTFRLNYALSRNVAQGETLVNCLIGIAGCGIMFPQVVEYVQQPKAPNLYWALTALPNPMIDMRRAVEVESRALELSFPELRDAANTTRSPDEWRDLFRRFANQILAWNHAGNGAPAMKTSEQLDKLCNDFAPIAKKTLIAEGVSAEKLNAMPVHQIALLYTLRTYHILFDDAAKNFPLPYPQAAKSTKAALERYKHPQENMREIIPISENTFKALDACRGAVARNERNFAVLRIFEALRIYGAAHANKLPAQLSDITEVPIPNDPITDKPFNYYQMGDKARLEGPAFHEVPLSYEIIMAAAN